MRDGSDRQPDSWLAAHDRIPLRILEGPVETSLLDAVADPDAIAAVFGARATRSAADRSVTPRCTCSNGPSKPIVVVPPEAVGIAPPAVPPPAGAAGRQ